MFQLCLQFLRLKQLDFKQKCISSKLKKNIPEIQLSCNRSFQKEDFLVSVLVSGSWLGMTDDGWQDLQAILYRNEAFL